MEIPKVFCVGIDDGFDETKISFLGKTFKIKSQARTGHISKTNVIGSMVSQYGYKTPDGNFVIGSISNCDPTSFDDYPVSSLNRVIVYHALRMAGVPSNAQVIACSGLPIMRYYKGQEKNINFIKRKRKNLKRVDIESVDKFVLPDIVKHDVVSEGIAAWMDYVISRDESGKCFFDKEKLEMNIAVVDVGGRTTDVCVIQNFDIDRERTDTADIGMLDVKEGLRKAINQEYDTEINDVQLNQAMSTKTIKLYGVEHNITEAYEEALADVVNKIETLVKKILKKTSDIDFIYMVGGGVYQMERFMRTWFKHVIISDDPSFANANGMSKYCEMMMNDNN